MKKALLGLGAAFAVFSLALPASAWQVDDLNKTISQTNFIVNSGCTGTLISLKYKLILTAYHCIDSFVSVSEHEVIKDGEVRKVKLEDLKDVPVSQKSYKDGRLVGNVDYQTKIVAKRKTYDLALLQVLSDDFPYTYASHVLSPGKIVRRGETAYAVGNPAGLDATVTQGIISSVNRTEITSWSDGGELAFLQYSGGIYFGNSGGALYNDEGELIGVPDALKGTSQLGLAISYTMIRKFLDESCYGDAWNDKIDSHDVCVKAKEEKAKKKAKEEKSD